MDNKDVDAEIHPLKNDEKVLKNNETDTDIREGIKKHSWLSSCRTGAFFASLFLCLTVVFAFSFIIPCPLRPFSQRTWSTQYTRAMTYTFLAAEDVNQDKVKDVIFLFQVEDNSKLNVSCEDGGFQFPCTFITALSGTNGSALWTRPVAEHVQLVECGISNLGGTQVSGCIIIGNPDSLLAINTETGNIVWQKTSQFPPNGVARNPVITIEDVNGDGVKDLMFIFSVEDELQTVIISGKNGDRIGQNRSIGIAKKEGHYIHLTASGSQYVLLYAGGSVEGYSVRDLCSKIKGDENKPAQYRIDPDWEAQSNLSVGYISILPISSSGDVRFLMKVPGKYYDNILVVKSEVSELLDGQKFNSLWSVNTTNIVSKPALGYFKKDVLSIMMELGIRNGRKKVIIVDSNSGTVQWEVKMNLGITNPSPVTLNTGDHRSIFLFWGEHTLEFNNSMERKEILYMFHPSYPTVLLQLNNHTENIVLFDAFLFEKSRHACYVLLTGPKTTENFGTVSVSKRKLKEDITNSKVIWLSKEESNDNEIRDHFFRMRYTSHAKA
ncbi:protein FAM234A [Spea bombifrons]|uniref:protein FAM234A n=1 Tax=Spea bombifrons TaxID=233779 RepID=UPI00234BEA78|nr:protein FAM234A [Spea bombifrons]XP_053328083.1 protein FAM234A [Spea bombifrons]